MNTRAIIILILVLILIGALPAWGIHSYGWAPAGGAGVVLLVLLVLIALNIL
jgi:hypothetical protein